MTGLIDELWDVALLGGTVGTKCAISVPTYCAR
jgi:hypothetical protein